MNYLILDAATTAAATKPTGGAGGLVAQIFPFALMFLILYFLVIKPQKKKQQEHQKMLDNLNIHDKVVTSGGIIGKIVNFKKDKTIVVIRVDETNNTKIEIQRASISGVLNEEKSGESVKN